MFIDLFFEREEMGGRERETPIGCLPQHFGERDDAPMNQVPWPGLPKWYFLTYLPKSALPHHTG